MEIRNVENPLRRNEALATRALIDNYREAIKKVRNELAAVYERYSVNGVLTHAEMSKYNRLVRLEHELREAVKPAIRANRSLMEKLAEVQYEESFYRHAWAIDQGVGASLKWGTLNNAAVKAAVQSPLRELSMRDLAFNTWDRIDRAIIQGLVRGESMPAMMRGVRRASKLTAADAMRIARTEAHRARELGNYASSEIAADQGVELKRQWVASLDDKTRASHASVDGEKVGLEERFSNGLLYPGDSSGDPTGAETINCRCTTIDVIEGLEPELRRTVEDGVQPYQTFETWAKDHGVTGSRYGQEYNYARR